MKIQGAMGVWGGRVWGIAAGAIVLLACAAMIPRATNRPTPAARQTKNVPMAQHEILASYGKLPLVFEKNLGQTSSRVKYLAHASGYTLFLTDKEAVLRLEAPTKDGPRTAHSLSRHHDLTTDNRKVAVVSLSLDGSQAPAQVDGLGAQPGHTNYLIGRDRSRWQKNVPMYGRVKYHGVYPGVDAVYYGNENRLETDYIVAPGSDPNRIALDVQGAKALKINSLGDVALTTAAGDLILHRPIVYQEIGGARREIAANYVERGKNSIGIRIGAYDSREQLVVDPVLDYSTFLGGSGGEAGNAIAVDASGNAYVCGSTSSSDFPVTPGAYLGTYPSKGINPTSAFIAELNPAGTALVFATYLGGSVSDSCTGIGLDSSGNVYVTGTTRSFDFPVSSNPILFSFPAGNLGTTGFFSELNSVGTALTYSTYLGGNYRDNPAGIAVDSSGNAYIVGSTGSTNFPLSTNYANVFQPISNSNDNGNGGAAFLSKISTSSGLPGTLGLLYSTYLGGSDVDSASAVAVDSVGNAYVTGTASSSDFPITPNAFQPNIGGFDNAFITRFDTTGQSTGVEGLVYSSYLGGSTSNGGAGNAIAIDSNFNAYIGGGTAVADFPTTPGAFMTQQPVAAYIMGFVARFNTNQQTASQSLVYSTYLGGSNVSGNYVFGIAVDPLGDAYVAGSTYTNNYPITLGSPQPGQAGISNAILTVFNPAGSALLFSTYFGGNTNDVANAIALDSAATPNAYITGTVRSANFPFTPGAFQTQLDGLTDAFVAKMSLAAAQGVFASPTTLGFGNQGTGTTSTAQTVTLTNNTAAALNNIVVTTTGANASDFIPASTCGASIAAFSFCTINVTFTPTISGAEAATLNIADSDVASSPQTVALTGTGTAVAVAPSSLSFGNQTQNTASAAQTVTLTNNGANPLTINSITVTGSNASDFGQTNTCGVSLTAGANCTISVIFTPTTQAAESASLNIADSDPSSPQLVALTGTGTQPLSGITVSPSALSFGNQAENTASVSQAVTLANGGATTLTISSISTTGTNASDFSLMSTCPTSPATLAGGGGSCTISVTFKPSTQAAETANLSIADSDASSPQVVPLTGTGTAPVTAFTVALSPTSATINAGDTINVVATVTSENAFNSPVGFTFANTPGDASIVASPSTVTPPANGSITSTITIVTDLKAAAVRPPFSSPFGSQHPLKVWTFMGLLLALFGTWTVRQRSAKRLAGAFAMILLIGLVSCTGTPSTPKGTYQVRISGVAGNQNFPATFTLTVK